MTGRRGGEPADEVLIVGGGPAGLATAACLGRRGIPARVLEQGPAVGHSWSQYYDRLHLHTGRHLSRLPGLPLGKDYPLYPARDEVVRYLRDYARRFDLRVSTDERVVAVRRDEARDGWRVETERDTRHAPAVVVASGTFHNPRRPRFPGLDDFGGPVLHAAEYRNPSSVAGRRVLVVGAGNSGAEIAVDLADAGREVTIAVRSGVHIVPRDLYGVLPVQYAAYVLQRLPPRLAGAITAAVDRQGRRRLASVGLPAAAGPLTTIPVIGLHLIDALRAGRVTARGGVARFRPGAVEFADGEVRPCDAVVLATGYEPALAFLRGLAADPATLVPPAGVACPAYPDLYFVGYHTSFNGTLYLIRQEAPQAARAIAARDASPVAG